MAEKINGMNDIEETKGVIATAAEAAAEQASEAVEEAAADIKEKTAARATKIKGEKEKLASEIKEEREQLSAELKAEKLEMKSRRKAVRKMYQMEAKQRRAELVNNVKEKRVNFRNSAKELSNDLKQLLHPDIVSMEHREKTRGAEILAIFAKHNFYAGGFTPEEMRSTLEDLGPTYVKIGQIMSSRVDLLPESYCNELGKLRSRVKQLDPEVARAVVEQETGKKIEEIFSEFEDKPLGSASIGQAHRATLLDGTKVVVKVQRPLIADMMRQDYALLKKAAGLINTISEGKEEDTEQVDLMSVIEELEKVTDEELDFRVEAENTIFFKENCIEDPTKINCPDVYPELTTERMMTMTLVDGYSISKLDRLTEDGYDPNAIGEVIVENFIHQVLDVGNFHADPHQGNIMVSHGIPYWIDFGMIGRLTPAQINLIQNLVLALVQQDTEALVDTALSMGVSTGKTDRAKLTEDADALISKYMSVTNLDELDTAVLMGDLSDIMAEHHIKVPGEYTMLVRALATIEGVMEELCPTFNLFEMISNKLLERAKQSFDLQQAILGAGKDVLAFGKKAARVPVLAADVLNSLAKGRSKINFELTGYQPLMEQLSDTVKNIILAVFSCVLFFGCCLLCLTDLQPKTANGIPLAAEVGILFAIALAIYTVRKLTRKK
ncbi:MAG: hypothetical protein IJ930_07245 [Lachnospiraceae bacterium]|nr:hypothetical protein [Lachnospiraceae bacterium]